MMTFKISQIGNSLGIVLSKEALATLNVGKGDVLYMTQGPDGVVRLSPYDPDIAAQIEMGEAIMDEYRDTFRALAK